MNHVKHYRRIRAEQPTVPAKWALRWAIDAERCDAIAAEIEWHWPTYWPGHGPIATGTVDDVELLIYDDPEPYDWGDIEPTEQDRRDLAVIGVGIRPAGDDDDLDSIWSVGYLTGDSETQAIETAVTYGFIDAARHEIAERERLAGYVETVR